MDEALWRQGDPLQAASEAIASSIEYPGASSFLPDEDLQRAREFPRVHIPGDSVTSPWNPADYVPSFLEVRDAASASIEHQRSSPLPEEIEQFLREQGYLPGGTVNTQCQRANGEPSAPSNGLNSQQAHRLPQTKLGRRKKSGHLKDVATWKKCAPAVANFSVTCRKVFDRGTPCTFAVQDESPHILPLICHSERAFSYAFRQKDPLQPCNASASAAHCDRGIHREPSSLEDEEEEEDHEEMDPIHMISYLNSCLSKAKYSLLHRGILVSTIDEKGMSVDFSSRPIDRIFKEAQAQRDREQFISLPRDEMTYDI